MARWIRTVRALTGLEQDEFKLYIGKSRSSVNMYERGDRNIPPDVVAAIMTSFPEAPMPPTAYGDLRPTGKALVVRETPIYTLPYAGIIPCGSGWGEPLDGREARPIDPEFTADNRYLCKVAGMSCYPALIEGDMTVWEEDRDPDWGVIVLAQRLEDGACTAKKLVYDSEAGRPRLIAVNPEEEAPPDDGGWEVVARLVGVIRRSGGPKRTWLWDAGLRPEHLI